MLDRHVEPVTVFVAPGTAPEVRRQPVATNHRGDRPEWPEHARRFSSVERRMLLDELVGARARVDTLVAALLRPPLHQTDYAGGFGTVYTAAYRPALGVLDLHWPGSTWRRTFDSPDATHTVELPQ